MGSPNIRMFLFKQKNIKVNKIQNITCIGSSKDEIWRKTHKNLHQN